VKIVISSFGTRGDVQPYLALAVGLQSAGHYVTLATSYNYTEWIKAYGVKAHPARFSVQEFTNKPETQAILRSRNLPRQIWLMREMMRQNAEAQDDVWAAIQDAEYVIQSPTASGALEAASLRGIPAAFAVPVPFAPTRTFPSFFLGASRRSLGAGYNHLTHWLMHVMLWSAMSGPITNPLRKKLGLRAWRSYAELMAHGRSLGTPWLYGFSANIIPKPADWDEYQHITGYWFVDAQPGWQPAEALVRFLDGGPPPIYIGFGSMSHENAERQTRLALRALELSGQRGVLAAGWGGLTREAISPNVLFVKDVPHAWLFPRMRAVVHHGGAGTTGAGLRAGVPNLITPFAPNDQSAWADRVARLGVGPRLPGIKQLTAEKLAGAIQTAATDAALRARAAALGEKIRAENGNARAVDVIERHAAGSHQVSPER
jgi:UDP:flavonoid glycosyltransferase YjiC (YdhE family)